MNDCFIRVCKTPLQDVDAHSPSRGADTYYCTPITSHTVLKGLQWNLSITDTLGPKIFTCTEVNSLSLVQRFPPGSSLREVPLLKLLPFFFELQTVITTCDFHYAQELFRKTCRHFGILYKRSCDLHFVSYLAHTAFVLAFYTVSPRNGFKFQPRLYELGRFLL